MPYEEPHLARLVIKVGTGYDRVLTQKYLPFVDFKTEPTTFNHKYLEQLYVKFIFVDIYLFIIAYRLFDSTL